MTIAVTTKSGEPAMPTHNIKKVRNLLKSGKADIVCYEPFTIRLNYDIELNNQPVDLDMDTGYEYIGISVKSEKHEYVSEERKLLPDEKKRHQKQKRTRNVRRNRGRYRKPRSKRENCSRKANQKWYAPSIQHKADLHIALAEKYCRYFPISRITLEMGQFDTHVLSAVNQGLPVPKGTDYQHGPKYGYDTLREAVFSRDKYRCRICHKNDAPLCIHHIGFRKGDRSNRLSNLLTVCSSCHTPKNHKMGGKLWNITPVSNSIASAAFMNTVKWYIYEKVTPLAPEVHITYGAVTKRTRKDRNIAKSHANDAYCIGRFFPKHRARTRHFEKRRRNNRCLEKFYDAKYVDVRDGKTKKAAELGCNRTKRSVPRNNVRNERRYRSRKVSRGARYIRTKRYMHQSGDKVLYRGKKRQVKGTHNNGASVQLVGGGDVSPKKLKHICHAGGWKCVG